MYRENALSHSAHTQETKCKIKNFYCFINKAFQLYWMINTTVPKILEKSSNTFVYKLFSACHLLFPMLTPRVFRPRPGGEMQPTVSLNGACSKLFEAYLAGYICSCKICHL